MSVSDEKFPTTTSKALTRIVRDAENPILNASLARISSVYGLDPDGALRHLDALKVLNLAFDEAEKSILSKYPFGDLAASSVVDLVVRDGLLSLRAAAEDPRFVEMRAELMNLAREREQIRDLLRATFLYNCSGGCGDLFRNDQLSYPEAPGVYGGYCDECVKKVLAREARRLRNRSIRAACARTRAAGLPTTLTQEQWSRALEFFENRCAYCKGQWYVVEHLLPTERGGGTTAENCVPSCYRCNRQKSPRSFDELRKDAGWGQAVEHIDRYLKAVRK